MKTLPKSYETAVRAIKSKGFSHIKLELEAQLNRGYAESDCQDCDDGYVNCIECGGDGWLETEREDASGLIYEREECYACGGEGTMDCDYCNGRGRSRNGATINWCQDFMEEHMGAEARRALVFGKFYDDHSVDSEYTFTMPIDKAHLCLEVIRAFNELNVAINGSHARMDVSNAGMHLSVLPEGNYPCRSGLLDADKMSNFKTEVTKLLPALYFLATHEGTTRRLTYRMPKVSHNDKYSAIYTHGDTCMEFRLFDTCYEKPEALLEKIQVVAATLKYYSQSTRDKVNIKYKEFLFPGEYSGDGQLISTWFENIGNYDALNQTIKQLKPADKSIQALKNERKLNTTRKRLMTKFQRHMEHYRGGYSSYLAEIARYNEHELHRYYCVVERCLREGSIRYAFTRAEEAILGTDPKKVAKLLANKTRAYKLFKRHYIDLDINIQKPATLRQYVLNQISDTSGPVLRPLQMANADY